MNLPKLCIIDRDSTLCYASHDPSSPLYYILSPDHLVLKPGVLEAVKLLRLHNIPMVLATKQRCVGRGLITRDQLFDINERLEKMLGVQFQAVYTEEIEDTKAGLYKEILERSGLAPNEVVLFDDSISERIIASSMGMNVCNGRNLLEGVQEVLSL